ncbi:hypothetical protein [Mycobacterium sp. Z3061]|uniref:hypothetical protein n=1 Tax=Mycobacterium sp. Z3061 TaxID=3073562 RepID=UPI002873E7B4|nr:hypothetical protein [Mycobacterium sp. Z3061]
MKSDDDVKPVDAAFQALLAHTAAETRDNEKRNKLIDGVLTLPPIAEWPPESQEKLWETCRVIEDLARDARRNEGNVT